MDKTFVKDMTIDDWFRGMALIGCSSHAGMTPEKIAKRADLIAREMIRLWNTVKENDSTSS